MRKDFAAVDLRVRAARSLPPSERRELGELILSGFPDTLEDDPEAADRWREHAWRTVPALWHVIAYQSERAVAQQSIFRLSRESDLIIFGLGDVVVMPAHRHRGLARLLVARAVTKCQQEGAQVIATQTGALQSVFAKLEFRLDLTGRWLTDEHGKPVGDSLWVWCAEGVEPLGVRLYPSDF